VVPQQLTTGDISRYSILTVVLMRLNIFQNMIPFQLVNSSWHFRGTCSLHLQGLCSLLYSGR